MPARVFVDTNIWIYAHLKAPADPRHGIAHGMLSSLRGAVISPQVVAEYYNVMLRNGMNDDWIQANIVSLLALCELKAADSAVVESALALRKRYGFSIWDAMIAAAALEADCDTLYSEDLQSGQVLDGRLLIVNPFGAAR